MTEQEALLL